MLLINSGETAMSTKYNMIDKMGITHDGTKVRRMLQLHKTFQAMGSPPATFTSPAIPVVMLTLSLRSSASITTGYSDGRPLGDYHTSFLTPHSSLLTSHSSLLTSHS